MTRSLFSALTVGLTLVVFPSLAQIPAQPGHPQYLMNEPIDISGDFHDFSNTYYLADSLAEFDMATGTGRLVYHRYEYFTRMAFDNTLGTLRRVPANEFPTNEYAASPELAFSVEFCSPGTVRLRASSGFDAPSAEESLMLVNGKAPVDRTSWKASRIEGGYQYTGKSGKVVIRTSPFHVEIYDANGKLLTSTVNQADFQSTTYTPVLPFSYVRRSSDYSRSFNAAFTLSPDEKIFGCGESFTQFNKRGQKVVLWADDANGVQNEAMYKPIPFFMSSRGYGIFMHTSTPVTCDFGKYFNAVNSLMIGDDNLDLFIFLGKPADILDAYTDITGKASMPPLWSFGLWMSRISYFSEKEVREVADKLRENKIPSDVLHLDTGWFETDWRCDYTFSVSRFDDPEKMIADLKKEGFHISLWQLPYFVPKNRLYPEIIEKGLYVRDDHGNPPYEDATLDFSNPNTVAWYQDKIGNLLKMGVGAIKVDFGEAAPATGLYASGRTGFYEHNLYPLRYNKAVADITKKVNGENIMWARSAWAGSQRYPLHWGGDAANSDDAMQAELRGGLSFGLSGFSFWSHDIGGFVNRTPEDIYRRWLPFGMLSSHSRCHGAPPKEPWEYGEDFNDYFRTVVDMKYRLMPYVYAQAKECTEKGLPMVRALFVRFPDDPGSWMIDNEYMFGSDILVAPMFEKASARDVYLPEGRWIDFQTGKVFDGGWHSMTPGKIEAVILVRDGAVIPEIKLAQSTMDMDWSKLDLVVYSGGTAPAEGLVCLPSDNVLHAVTLDKKGNGYVLREDPYKGNVKFRTRMYTEVKEPAGL